MIKHNNNISDDINYTHSTKEVIQMIKILQGELIIPHPYNRFCFRTSICNKSHIDLNESYKTRFDKSDLCVIEICSTKTYIHNQFYLHHLCVDKRFPNHTVNTPSEIINNFNIENQTENEIENDILEIQKILENKKLIIVSHYNSTCNGKYIKSRNNLINILDSICKKHNIHFVNPSNVLSKFSQDKVLQNDLGHYTDFGHDMFTKYMDDYIHSLFF